MSAKNNIDIIEIGEETLAITLRDTTANSNDALAGW